MMMKKSNILCLRKLLLVVSKHCRYKYKVENTTHYMYNNIIEGLKINSPFSQSRSHIILVLCLVHVKFRPTLSHDRLGSIHTCKDSDLQKKGGGE